MENTQTTKMYYITGGNALSSMKVWEKNVYDFARVWFSHIITEAQLQDLVDDLIKIASSHKNYQGGIYLTQWNKFSRPEDLRFIHVSEKFGICLRPILGMYGAAK